MITSPHNEKLKLIRKLQARKHRERSGLFAAEGEDLVAAAERAGAEAEFVLVAGASEVLAEVNLQAPFVLCLGAERDGLPADVAALADATARIPMRPGAPDSLNVASAAAVGLYEVANRMADRA